MDEQTTTSSGFCGLQCHAGHEATRRRGPGEAQGQGGRRSEHDTGREASRGTHLETCHGEVCLRAKGVSVAVTDTWRW